MKQKEHRLRKIEAPISILGIGKWNATIFVRITFVGNNGIGSYECHGFKGHDIGSNYVEEFEVENILLNGRKPDSILYRRVLDLLYEFSEEGLFEKIADLLIEFEEDELAEEEELAEEKERLYLTDDAYLYIGISATPVDIVKVRLSDFTNKK